MLINIIVDLFTPTEWIEEKVKTDSCGSNKWEMNYDSTEHSKHAYGVLRMNKEKMKC